MALSDDRVARYARQLLVPGFGEEAQQRLLEARVRAVGAEAAAGPALAYLVQAGVGRLWIDDPEDVIKVAKVRGKGSRQNNLVKSAGDSKQQRNTDLR